MMGLNLNRAEHGNLLGFGYVSKAGEIAIGLQGAYSLYCLSEKNEMYNTHSIGSPAF